MWGRGVERFTDIGEDIPVNGNASVDITAPATDAARQWQGWGTALKPSLEPITMARKPLMSTVAENVLAHGTGALNIDGCRVGQELRHNPSAGNKNLENRHTVTPINRHNEFEGRNCVGRWPANLIHDGSDEVLLSFPVTGPSKAGVRDPNGSMGYHGGASGLPGVVSGYADGGGSAARFFYCAKASKRDRDEGLDGLAERKAGSLNMRTDSHSERNGMTTAPRRNTHPTVKPTTLMRYLCRLITPPGGTILDPFAGSGSTGKAAKMEGFNFVGIEREKEYCEIAKKRIESAARYLD